MRTLYHFFLSPQSRKIRLALGEKGLSFDLAAERHWERRPEFLAMNPAGDLPVLVEEDGTILADGQAIAEYLEEVYVERPLIVGGPVARAEIRRLTQWFDIKFSAEVGENLLGEKIMKRLFGGEQPHALAIRAGLTNIHYHLDYIAYLAERRRWLAGDDFSLADITAAAHISVIDYIGDVPWEDHPGAKDWFARVKSRPSFRPLLTDHVPGAPPPPHYGNLDF